MLASTLPSNSNTGIVVAKGDSIALKHYLQEEESHLLSNKTDYIGPKVVLPNNKEIQATKKGQLPLSKDLSKEAKEGTVLSQLKNSLLISHGKLCDDDCKVLLTKESLKIIKSKIIVLEGICNHSDGL